MLIGCPKFPLGSAKRNNFDKHTLVLAATVRLYGLLMVASVDRWNISADNLKASLTMCCGLLKYG